MTHDNVHIISTERLRISHLSFADNGFILELLNERSFIQFIGDRDVRTEQDASEYLAHGPLDSYAKTALA